MREHYSLEHSDPRCIYKFIECERDLKCDLCDLASSRSGITRLCSNLCQIIHDKSVGDALGYYQKLRYTLGISTANALKAKLGKEAISPKALRNSLMSHYTCLGMDYKIKTYNGYLEVTINECPFYREFYSLGLDSSLIKDFCDYGSKGQHEAITKVFPSLEPYSKHRKSIGEVCIEGYRIK